METKTSQLNTGLLIAIFVVALAALLANLFSYRMPLGFMPQASMMAGADHTEMMEHMDMDDHLMAFAEHREHLQDEHRDHGDYACCLNKPCVSCLELTPWHGEEATCHCLDDIVNGEHPCGECVGGILGGRGNPYLKEYFAPAIAEGVGEQYLDEIQEIIDEKYPKEE